MKACLNQNTLRTTPTENFLQIARRADFDAVELTWTNVEAFIETSAINELKEKIEDQGLTVASVNGPEKFNLLDEEAFSKLLGRTRRLAGACREIGCNLLVPVPSLVQTPKSIKTILADAARSLDALAEVVGEDIKLGLEFLGMQTCSINDLQTATKVIDLVTKRNVGLVLDSFHMHLSKTAFSQVQKIKGNTIFLVHVDDSEVGDVEILTDANRLLPGEGVLNLHEFRTSLSRVGYDGFLSLELFRPSFWQQDAGEIAKQGRESLRRVFEI